MKKIFRYVERAGQQFPAISVTVGYKKRELTVLALVDSGASFSVLRPEVAQELGIKIEQGKQIFLTGIGGRILGYLHALSFSVGTKTFRSKVVFSPEFNVSFNILGRHNFFAPFLITFAEKKKQVIIQDI